MASGTLTLGGIQYEIVAVDKTKDGIDTAKANVKDLEKTNEDSLTNIIDAYGLLALQGTAAMIAIQQGYAKTVGTAIAYQDQVESLHNTLGLTNEDAQKWRQAAIATDTDIQSVSVSMRYLTQRISDSGEAGDNLRATLKSIGVDAKDAAGNYKDSSTLFQEILLGLNKIPAGTERASAAAQIFGRNWYNIAEMINNADTAVAKFKESQPLFSDEELERIDQAKLKIALFSEELNAAGAKAGASIISIGEHTVTGYKIWESALKLDLQGIKDAVKEMNDAEKAIDDAVRKSFESTLKTSGRSLGEFVPTGTGPFGTTIGLFKPAADDAAKSTENLFLNLSDTDREIKYQSEVVIPKYEEALKAAQEAGNGVAEAQYNLANAMDHLNDLKTQDTDKTKAQVDAYKEYKSAVEDLNDAKEKLYDLDMDYADEMQNAGMDVAAGRRATMSYNRQRRSLIGDLGDAQMDVTESATEFNQVQSGTPLEQIKGTEQYEKAQATTIGQITIENINLSQDYTANDFMNDLTAGRIAKGVPISR